MNSFLSSRAFLGSVFLGQPHQMLSTSTTQPPSMFYYSWIQVVRPWNQSALPNISLVASYKWSCEQLVLTRCSYTPFGAVGPSEHEDKEI